MLNRNNSVLCVLQNSQVHQNIKTLSAFVYSKSETFGLSVLPSRWFCYAYNSHPHDSLFNYINVRA